MPKNRAEFGCVSQYSIASILQMNSFCLRYWQGEIYLMYYTQFKQILTFLKMI